jgi:hypothetical protein
VNVKRGCSYWKTGRFDLFVQARIGPFGLMVITTTVLCMNCIGGSSCTVNGAFDAAIGSSAARSCSLVTSGAIGPIPTIP